MENPAVFVESFGNFRACRAEGEISVNIVFDERNFALGKHLDEFLFLFVRHAASQRIAEVQREDARFDPAGFEALFQFIEADAVARKSWNFTYAHSKRFDDLQDAEESG